MRQPPVAGGDPAVRARIRVMRERARVLLAAIDDDPTGSQCVHGVDLVMDLDRTLLRRALQRPGGSCFVLTNSRSLAEDSAAALTASVAGDLLEVADDRPLQLLSRSDSTLRGHVLAEVNALTSVQPRCDGVIFAPAYLEAGRMTVDDVHLARIGGELVPVAQSEFAKDAAFGYRSSNLREFLAERSGGRVDAVSLGLDVIRDGGPDGVRTALSRATNGCWVVVNATEYSDLETVALGVLAAEAEGQSFVFRTGPSFVRALAGIEPSEPLATGDIWAAGRPDGHGLVVVGSHMEQTTRQMTELRSRGWTVDVELNVPALLESPGSAERIVREATARVVRGLASTDVLLSTSRAVNTGSDATSSLAISRAVSASIVRVVQGALAARPAWVVGKGGITSHDVAQRGLGIRRAEVVGQMLPGLISVLRPTDAPATVVGTPYVVFAGNVGDDNALAHVVGVLRGERP